MSGCESPWTFLHGSKLHVMRTGFRGTGDFGLNLTSVRRCGFPSNNSLHVSEFLRVMRISSPVYTCFPSRSCSQNCESTSCGDRHPTNASGYGEVSSFDILDFPAFGSPMSKIVFCFGLSLESFMM